MCFGKWQEIRVVRTWVLQGRGRRWCQGAILEPSLAFLVVKYNDLPGTEAANISTWRLLSSTGLFTGTLWQREGPGPRRPVGRLTASQVGENSLHQHVVAGEKRETRLARIWQLTPYRVWKWKRNGRNSSEISGLGGWWCLHYGNRKQEKEVSGDIIASTCIHLISVYWGFPMCQTLCHAWENRTASGLVKFMGYCGLLILGKI